MKFSCHFATLSDDLLMITDVDSYEDGDGQALRDTLNRFEFIAIQYFGSARRLLVSRFCRCKVMSIASILPHHFNEVFIF